MIRGLHHALQGLLGRDVAQLDGDAIVLDRLIEENVDAERVAQRAIDILHRRFAREGKRDWLLRRRIELWRLGLGDAPCRYPPLELIDRDVLRRGAVGFLDHVDRFLQLHRGELIR